VIGEELYAKSLCRELTKLPDVSFTGVFSPGCLPTRKMDVMIHLNDTEPNLYAHKHVLYMQNFYPEGSAAVLHRLHKENFDGYAFFSERLLEFHQSYGYTGIFLPLAADTDIFHPAPGSPNQKYDVVYVGNDIKDEERTMLYIYPAINFDFGLFGNWNQRWHFRPYKNALRSISQGPVSREQAAILFSNAKIVINFTDTDSIIWDAMNLRFFEVLACKGFLISDMVPSARCQLKDCTVFSYGGNDLVEKIKYYLDRPEERMEMAERGYQYVIENATVSLRAKQLYEYLQQIVD
jgi:spore maturation protein CgeB